MAKSDFICKSCKKTVTFGFLSSPVKYECPTHKTLCKDCVETHLLTRNTCKKCGSKVIKFKFENGRWNRA